MDDFSYLHFADEESLAVALAPDDPELEVRLANGGWIHDWKALRFQVGDGLITDYLANSFAFRLCSIRLRETLDSHRAPADIVQWLPAIVTTHMGQELTYSILHFPEVPNVLNLGKSILAGPMIVKACLDRELVDGHRIFSFPQETLRLVIADDVKKAVETAGCGGMKFSKVPIT